MSNVTRILKLAKNAPECIFCTSKATTHITSTTKLGMVHFYVCPQHDDKEDRNSIVLSVIQSALIDSGEPLPIPEARAREILDRKGLLQHVN